MTLFAFLCALGLPAGFVLLWRVPRCGKISDAALPELSILVPARNEERNLPRLLRSLEGVQSASTEIVVVDDASTDRTASVALKHGANVLSGAKLPQGWTGKTWACAQGACAARAQLLVFLDADTWFAPLGMVSAVGYYSLLDDDSAALSLLPYHETREPYEELSLFFNLLMAFGAGGFGMTGNARLFGQSLILSRRLYELCGGHAGVRSEILENFALADRVKQAGGRCVCIGGRGVLHVRMFPDGFAQLREGWLKAFAQGAAGSDGRVLALSIFWLSALCSTFFLAVMTRGAVQLCFGFMYASFALQLYMLARQIGTFRVLTCALYPIPLVFFFALFTQSLVRRVLKQKVTWRGREL